jgi:hypothetical protein
VPQVAKSLSNALETLQSHSNDEIKYASEWIMIFSSQYVFSALWGFQESGQGSPRGLFISPTMKQCHYPFGANFRVVTGQGGGALLVFVNAIKS